MASPTNQRMTNWLFGLGILLLAVGIVLGLGNPFTAIVLLVIIAGCLIGIAFRLMQCFQLARGKNANKLVTLTLFLIAGLCTIIAHLGNVIQSNDPALAFNPFIFLCLYYAMELVADLLQQTKALNEREHTLQPQ